MMRSGLSIILATVITSCMSHQELSMTGNDRDDHGCIPSSGYQWSKLTQKCLRAFELEIQLNSVAAGTKYSAGMLLSADKLIAEVFLKEGVFLFEKQPDTSYYSDADGMMLTLELMNGVWCLSSEGTILYQQYR